jgi:di/tricarboxylate transporter
MSPAAISVAALVVALTASCVSTANVGVLAIVLAWIVGVYVEGLSLGEVLSAFPTALFLTLVGVTLLFAQAQVNGTLDRIAHRAVSLCRGHAGVIPIMFFFLTAGLASIGPGNIAAAALIAPMGMAVAARYGISLFLMAIMIGNGASSGALSPFAPTGIIVNGIMPTIGLPDVEWASYANNFLAHAAVAFGGYVLLGGWKLFVRRPGAAGGLVVPDGGEITQDALESRHWLTLGVIAALLIGVIVFDLNVGMGAFAGSVLLTLSGAADEGRAMRSMPWRVIVMVTGVTVLIGLMQRTGGMDLFSDFLARLATPRSVTAVSAFFTGVISIYSSTSGVVLPAFLPTVPGLIERLGGGDLMAVASAMNVGAHLVDVSPLSTTGALCLAGAPLTADNRDLFNKLLAWGLSMTVVGSLICWLFFR